MNIKQAAQASGLTAKMLRYYESIGLLPEVSRSESGYRQYTDIDIQSLSFIRRSRELGFSLAQIGELLSLWKDDHRTSRQVKTIAQSHIQALDLRIAALQNMRNDLLKIAAHCNGDNQPDCPILENIAGI